MSTLPRNDSSRCTSLALDSPARYARCGRSNARPHSLPDGYFAKFRESRRINRRTILVSRARIAAVIEALTRSRFCQRESASVVAVHLCIVVPSGAVIRADAVRTSRHATEVVDSRAEIGNLLNDTEGIVDGARRILFHQGQVGNHCFDARVQMCPMATHLRETVITREPKVG